MIGINNGDAMVYINTLQTDNTFLSVRLIGKAGNPNAIGSRITLVSSDGGRQVKEVYGGHGYLSQSSSEVIFGLPHGRTAKEAVVRWPTGAETRHRLESTGRVLISESKEPR
jgi:hypothetical protein